LQNFHVKLGRPRTVECRRPCVNDVSINKKPGKVNTEAMQRKIFIFDLVMLILL